VEPDLRAAEAEPAEAAAERLHLASKSPVVLRWHGQA
jgi:hypothetical protein